MESSPYVLHVPRYTQQVVHIRIPLVVCGVCSVMTMVTHSTSVAYNSSTLSVSVVCIPLATVYCMVVLMEGSIHPYDVLEAEPEVVSGYYVDYGGYVFMLVYLGEGVVIHQVPCSV